MTDKAQPWYRQEDETSEQFSLFELYLRERNVKEVAKIYFAGRDALALDAGRVYANHLKGQKHWNARCAAYDRWVAKQKDDATTQLIAAETASIKKQRIAIVRKIGQKVNKAIDSVTLESITSKELYKVQTLVSMAESLFRLWEKFEQTNPAALTSTKPFESEIAGAQEKLMLVIEQKMKKINSDESNQEILQ